MKKPRRAKKNRRLTDAAMLPILASGIAVNNRQITGATMVIVGLYLMAS
jgi:hypothetical protein